MKYESIGWCKDMHEVAKFINHEVKQYGKDNNYIKSMPKVKVKNLWDKKEPGRALVANYRVKVTWKETKK